MAGSDAGVASESIFRLFYIASLFVKEGLVYLLTFDRLIDTSPGSVYASVSTPQIWKAIFGLEKTSDSRTDCGTVLKQIKKFS